MIRLKDSSVKQLSVLFLLLSVGPAIVFGIVVYAISSNAVFSNAASMMNVIVQQNVDRMQLLLEVVDETQMRISSSDALMQLLVNPPAGGSEALYYANLQKLLDKARPSPDIRYVEWYPLQAGENSQFVDSGSADHYERSDWYNDSALRQGGTVWKLEKRIGNASQSGEWLLTRYRLLYDTDSFARRGIVGISLSADWLKKLAVLPENLEGQRMMIVSERGIVYMDTNPSDESLGQPLTRVSPALAEERRNPQSASGNIGGLYVTRTTMKQTGMSLVHIIPSRSLLGSLKWVLRGIPLLTVGILLLSLPLVALMYSRIVLPIVKLASWMKKVERGNLDAKPEFRVQGGEAAYLFHAFSRLLSRIQQQIGLIRRSERLKREWEIKALNYQIRPHFIYNTLDSMKWKATNRQHAKVVEMIAALSGLLRFTFRPGDEVHVRDEVQHLQYYIELEQMKADRPFHVFYDIDSAARICIVPRLCLQPVVENAIKHGVKASTTTGTIIVSIALEEERLRIKVTDNGPGFPQGYRLDTHDDDRETGGIGLRNVYKRMKLYAGDSFRMSCSNVPGEGAVVEMSMPLTAMFNKEEI